MRFVIDEGRREVNKEYSNIGAIQVEKGIVEKSQDSVISSSVGFVPNLEWAKVFIGEGQQASKNQLIKIFHFNGDQRNRAVII